MCLIVFAWQAHPRYRLIVAANRDELHRRPALAADWWRDRPGVLGGRDLEAGGSWLAVSRSGRFAAVTNYREDRPPRPAKRSRGQLVADFVASADAPQAFAATLDTSLHAGFCMLAAARDELLYLSNRGGRARLLPPGTYGLSNAALDTAWPKLLRSRERLRELLQANAITTPELLRLLADRTPADTAVTADLPFVLAHNLSAPFVVSPEYGTRCSSVLLWGHDGQVEFSERRFASNGEQSGESQFRFSAVEGAAQSA